MGYLGLVPSERSTGDTVRRGGITKAGNRRVRHMLVESAWTYRHPSKLGKQKLYLLQDMPPKVGLWSNLGDGGGGVSSVMVEITDGRIRHGGGYRRWAAAARRDGRG
jgi:hypothetical protein